MVVSLVAPLALLRLLFTHLITSPLKPKYSELSVIQEIGSALFSKHGRGALAFGIGILPPGIHTDKAGPLPRIG